MPERPSASPSDQIGPRKLRAVLDTNVFVSGLMALKSPPRRIIDAWLEGQFTLVTSLYLVEELTYVLGYPRIAKHIRLSRSEVDAVLAALLSQAEVTPGVLELPGVTRDPKDDAVVACAVEGEADYIVSGDEDLLVLEVYAGTKVVAPHRFLRMLREGDAGS